MKQKEITLTLNQASIEDALVSYVSDMGINLEGAEVSISLTAGRGANGHSADLTISRKVEGGATTSTKTAESKPEKKVAKVKEVKEEKEPETTEDNSTKNVKEESDDDSNIEIAEDSESENKSIFG